jgi:hypothetical protein
MRLSVRQGYVVSSTLSISAVGIKKQSRMVHVMQSCSNTRLSNTLYVPLNTQKGTPDAGNSVSCHNYGCTSEL